VQFGRRLRQGRGLASQAEAASGDRHGGEGVVARGGQALALATLCTLLFLTFLYPDLERAFSRSPACRPVHPLTMGSDPVGRWPVAMPSTISAADHLRRSVRPSDDRRQVLDLLLVLAAVECHASVGGPAVVPRALLRDVVIIIGRLAGRTRLEANADSTAAFTALQVTSEPPLPELDQVLARVLADRFGLPAPRAAA